MRAVFYLPFCLIFTQIIFAQVLLESSPASAAIEYDAQNAYVVLVSDSTFAEWQQVVTILRNKYNGAVIVYPAGKLHLALAPLRRIFPRYACFVARSEEANRNFIVSIHRMTRKLDADPYTDVIWGVLTGYTVADARRIAGRRNPLLLRRLLSATAAISFDGFGTGIKFDETKAGKGWLKNSNAVVSEKKFPKDSTRCLVKALDKFKPDVFITSGHATERDWQIGYNYRDGHFRCHHGQLYAIDTARRSYRIDSPNSKVYLPVGNCLIGHIPSPDCMALALMHSAGVDQMFGYMGVTLFGYMGWGIADLFIGQRDRYTLAQAFYFNNQALLYELHQKFPTKAAIDFSDYDPRKISYLAWRHQIKSRELMGLLWDRDIVAFYGDPAWPVRFPPNPPNWSYRWHQKRAKHFTLSITTLHKGNWGKRPTILPTPFRLGHIQNIRCNQPIKAVVVDNFVLLPLSGNYEPGFLCRLEFSARRINSPATSATTPPVRADQN